LTFFVTEKRNFKTCAFGATRTLNFGNAQTPIG
jgi:hypothetical protein